MLIKILGAKTNKHIQYRGFLNLNDSNEFKHIELGYVWLSGVIQNLRIH